MKGLDEALREVTAEYEVMCGRTMSPETSRAMRDSAHKDWAQGVRRMQAALAAVAAALIVLSWWGASCRYRTQRR